jgi:hypothetical protein
LAGALGAAGGGIAGYNSSDKRNNAPATILGTFGGGIGAAAGLHSSVPLVNAIADATDEVNTKKFRLANLESSLQNLRKQPARGSRDIIDRIDKEFDIKALKKSLAGTPKWVRALAKRPKLHNALAIGALGLGAGAGGTLGATLGTLGGDALA